MPETYSDTPSDAYVTIFSELAETVANVYSAGMSRAEYLAALGMKPIDPGELQALTYAAYPELRPTPLKSDSGVRRGHLTVVNGARKISSGELADAQAAITGVARLSVLTRHPDEDVRRQAMAGLAEVHDAFQPRTDPDRVETRLFTLGRRIDDFLSDLRAGAPRFPVPPIVEMIWIPGGLLTTIGVGALLLTGHPIIAGMLLLGRLLTTIFIGGPGTLPFEGIERNLEGVERMATPLALLRCHVTHAVDTLMIGVFVVYAYMHGSVVGMAFGVVAIVTLLFGTMARMSVLQLGVQVTRLTLERVVRVGPMIVALWLLNFDPTVLVVAGVVPSMVYGLGEIVRVHRRLQCALIGRYARSISLTVEDTMNDGSYNVRHVDRSLCIDCDPFKAVG
mgnify:FL=1